MVFIFVYLFLFLVFYFVALTTRGEWGKMGVRGECGVKIINLDKIAKKELERIDVSMRRRVIDGIAGLLKEPPQGDIKQLKGALGGLRRLRVGNWRIIYEVTAETIDILSISPRGGAYKKGG